EPVRRYPAMVIGTGESEDLPGFGWKEAFGGGLLGFLEGFGREFIREPLATATTVASLMESDEWGKGWGALLDGSTWKKAHEISQSRSMGQAVAMAFLTKDILDEDEVMRAQNSSWYGFISGSFDAAARIFLDTDTLLAAGAGKGL